MGIKHCISMICIAMMLLAGSSACRSGKKKTTKESPPPAATRSTPSEPPAIPVAVAGDPARQTKLLRFPDIHEDLVVFTYAGDLWLVKSAGGTAVRLTSHPGLELFAKFSPDGKWIAFTAQYSGDEQVYVVPTSGGEPRQLTFYPAKGPLPARWGYDNQVYGWTPDGSQVLFRSIRNSFDLATPRLYLAPVAGGLPVALPMLKAGAGDLDGSGQKVAYSPLFRDFRTWKRYEGGWAQDLYIFNLQEKTAERVTKHARSDRDPMWIGDDLYFGSDRDSIHNLYRYDVAAKKVSQITSFKDWDVRWPSSDGKGQIVFEYNGELQVLSVAGQEAGQARELAIFVPDDGARTRPERIDASKNIEHFDLGPTGKRAVFVARGDVFSIPAEHGLVRNLTHSSNAHEREASWSPAGKQVAFVSDWTGEEEIWVASHDGTSAPRAITSEKRGRLYNPLWSHDGSRIAYGDQTGKLLVVTVTGGKVTEVADDPIGRISPDYRWSPDSRYLAFSRRDPSGFSSVYVWDTRGGQTQRLTGELFSEWSPAWHPDGKHIYYLSNREFHPQLDTREWNFMSNRSTGIFALALAKDSPNPFAPRDDVAGKKDDDKKAGKGPGPGGAGAGANANKSKPATVRIDFEGIAGRVTRVPVEADNYQSLMATKDHLLYIKSAPPYYGRDPDFHSVLTVFSLKERKAQPMVNDVGGWSMSRDGKKVLVRGASKPDYKIHDVAYKPGNGPPGPPDGKAKPLALDGLVVHRVAREEWAVVYNDVWRRFRDHFYVANMHGYDWKALGDKYRPLLDHVGHRSDLNYVLGELIAELNVSHAYVSGGDEGLPQRPHVALLGVRFELDGGAYRIAKVFEGHNEEQAFRSPLTEVGVGIKVGDYVQAINGRALTGDQNPYALLQLPRGKPVELTVSSDAAGRQARTVLVDPITDETNLVYLQWTEKNRRYVDKATDGKVGYFHVPDMGASGISQFAKWFYPQIRKEGLIVDVRGNGGGNVSQMLIERLRRKLYGTDFARNADETFTYPSVVFYGPMVALVSETSASDGDIFPYMFREAGLGPLIGKRSWGGVVGITNRGPLIDGGVVYVPEFGTASAEGKWVIEGKGVEPDIEVENDPVAIIEGKDAQLDRAITEVTERMKTGPTQLPARPADPDKTPK